MRKASSEPGPAPPGGAIDGGTVSARASAGVAWHVPEIAVTLPEGPQLSARLAPVPREVLAGVVNRADSSSGAD